MVHPAAYNGTYGQVATLSYVGTALSVRAAPETERMGVLAFAAHHPLAPAAHHLSQLLAVHAGSRIGGRLEGVGSNNIFHARIVQPEPPEASRVIAVAEWLFALHHVRPDAGRVPWYAYRDNLPITRGYLVGFVSPR